LIAAAKLERLARAWVRRALAQVRPGFRAKHNYASRPGRKAGGVFLRSENAEAGPRKTAMRFMRGEAYVSAEPERERDHGVVDSVPAAAHALASPDWASRGSLAQSPPAPHFFSIQAKVRGEPGITIFAE